MTPMDEDGMDSASRFGLGNHEWDELHEWGTTGVIREIRLIRGWSVSLMFSDGKECPLFLFFSSLRAPTPSVVWEGR